MENFKAVQDASETAMNSMGSAVRENEKYLDSIQGKTAQLTSSMEKMWYNAIDSDTIKAFVGTANVLVKTIDNIANNSMSKFIIQSALVAGSLTLLQTGATKLSTTLLASKTMVALKTASLNAYSEALIIAQMYQKGLISATELLKYSFATATSAVKSLSKALLKSPFIIIMIAVAAVNAIIKVINHLTTIVERQKEKVQELSSAYDNLATELSNAKNELKEITDRINELNNKKNLSIADEDELEQLELTNKELKQKIELLEAEAEMTSEELGTETVRSYRQQFGEGVKVVKEAIEEYKSLYEAGMPPSIDPSNISALIAGYEYFTELQAKSTDHREQEIFKTNIKGIKNSLIQTGNQLVTVRDELRKVQNPTQEELQIIEDINTALNYTRGIISPDKLFNETWNKLTRDQKEYLKTLAKNEKLTPEVIKRYEQLNDLVNTVGFGYDRLKSYIEKQIDSQEELSSTFTSIVEDAEKYKETIDNLNKEIDTSINTIQRLNIAIKELSISEGLSEKSLNELVKNYPDLIMYLDDEQKLREELNKILEQETQAQKKLFKSKLELNTEYFNQMIKGNVNLWNAISQYYNVDAKNFQTVADVKKKINDELVAYIGESWSKLYGSEIEALNSIEQGLVTGLSQVHDEATKRQMIQQLEDVRKKKEILEGINKPLESTVNKIDFDKLNISKDNKSSSSKTTDLINVEIDRFSNLQQAIDDTNNKIEIYKQLISFTDDLKKRNEYENELIKLYDEQKKQIHEITDAQRNAIKENINTLKGYGFDIEYDPTANRLRIKNEEQINKIYGKNNEETNELRKNIEKIIKETKEWNKVNQENGREWQDLNNQIREINQAKLDYVKDTEKEIARIIKDSVDSEKKALDDKLKKYKDTVDERKRLLDEEYSEEEYLRNLRKEEEKAAEIARKIENQKLDNSHDSYQKTLELEKELAEQEERIWEMKNRKSYEDQVKNLDLQYEAQEKYVENRKSSLDKEFNDERINLMAQQALINGFYTDIHGNTVSFKDNFSSLMKELGVAIEDNFITQLEYAKILINELNNIDTSKIGEMIQLRSYYESLGKKVDWQNGNVLVDGKAIDLSGLENINGRFYGTKDVLDQKIGLSNSSSNTLTSMKTLLQNSLTALKGIGLSSILPPEATVNNKSVGDIIVNVQTSEVNKNNASDVGNTISNSILKKIRDGILTGRS